MRPPRGRVMIATDVAASIERQSALAGRAPAEVDLVVQARLAKEFARHSAAVDARLDELRAKGLDTAREQMVREFAAASAEFRQQASEVFKLAAAFAQQQAAQIVDGRFANAEARVKAEPAPWPCTPSGCTTWSRASSWTRRTASRRRASGRARGGARPHASARLTRTSGDRPLGSALAVFPLHFR